MCINKYIFNYIGCINYLTISWYRLKTIFVVVYFKILSILKIFFSWDNKRSSASFSAPLRMFSCEFWTKKKIGLKNAPWLFTSCRDDSALISSSSGVDMDGHRCQVAPWKSPLQPLLVAGSIQLSPAMWCLHFNHNIPCLKTVYFQLWQLPRDWTQ